MSLEPEPPTGDGTTNGWHTASNSNCVWMSQKVAISASEGEWGNPIPLRGEDGVITEDDWETINNIVAEKVAENLDNAEIASSQDLEDAKTELSNALKDLETAYQQGDQAAIEAAKNAVAKADAANTLANNTSVGLQTLQEAFDNLDKGLSEEDVKLLAIAALQDETKLPEGGQAIESVFAQNVIALVGTFAEINAENIGAGTISGNTLQSSEPISEEDDRPK